MKKFRKSSHTIHDLKVHLVWITKYRRTVLRTEIGHRAREIIRQVCDANDVRIISGRISRDHVHMFVSYPPHLSVSEMAKRMKGRSSKLLQSEFKELGKTYWGKHFWAVGYAAFSSGHVTDDMIKDYLKHHDKHPNHNDDEFKVT